MAQPLRRDHAASSRGRATTRHNAENVGTAQPRRAVADAWVVLHLDAEHGSMRVRAEQFLRHGYLIVKVVVRRATGTASDDTR